MDTKTSAKITHLANKPNKNITDIEPDFSLHETDEWLVFPHEISGLTAEEIRANKPDIAHTVIPHINK